MPSDFVAAYERARDEYYAATKQYPQLKVTVTGKTKTSGIADDLKSLDAALEAKNLDVKSLMDAFQSLTKHMSAYCNQLDATDDQGKKGVFEWMAKSTGKPVEEKDKKLISKQSRVYSGKLATLYQRAKAEVEARTEALKSRSDRNALLKAVKKEAPGWLKYTEIPAVKYIADTSDLSKLIVRLDTRQTPKVVREAQAEAAQARDDLRKWVAAIGKVDDSPILGSSSRKSFQAMFQAVQEVQVAATALYSALGKWQGGYLEAEAEIRKFFDKNPDPAALQDFEARAATVSKMYPPIKAAIDKFKVNFGGKLDSILAMLQQQTPDA